MTSGEIALYLLVAAGVTALAAGLHVAFWGWWLRVEPAVDEVLWARTRDGWTLGVSHRRPQGPRRRCPPVLLVHGLAMNRQAFDFGVEAHSLAVRLSRDGFDCFMLDQRGHGLSRRGPSRHWDLDDYLREDFAAALDAVRDATGEPDVLWVGHSQGALLGLAACVLHPGRIRAIAALAPPVFYDRQERLRRLVSWRRLALARHFRAVARWLSPIVGLWHPELAEVVLSSRNMSRPIYRRFMANGVENLQPGVLDQFATFVAENSFRSVDGATDYRALLPLARQPAIFISAERDGLAPPAVVRDAFDLWGGPKTYWGAEHGYGHVDLLLGRGAPDYVFPVVHGFLLRHASDRGTERGMAPGPRPAV
jgi:pimeloyl-ACP methyl ester carboxylesterase